ncbi:nuclear transport factor 2 family protein [Paraherbaspirillum soli]|uniref:Nuclear transport factor 2 family protein n=1 Tax=Paraherbaspirillum soli TaxID=631222 RepID=A0ABW0M6G5_9BURK
MSHLINLIDRYIAVWNETDAGRRAELIAATWADNASYLDPMMQGDGHAGIAAMVAGVHQQFPGHRFYRTSDVESHHDRIRFRWELRPEQGPALVTGTDFGTLAGDERLQSITGFFDTMPAQA